MSRKSKEAKKAGEQKRQTQAGQAARANGDLLPNAMSPAAAIGESYPPGLFVVGPDGWLNEYVERVQDGLGLLDLTDSQRATLERILSDEDSLLRMWCDGRLDGWREAALAEKPPQLVAGVLPSPDMTLGADWELPFARRVLKDEPDSNRFVGFFYEQLEQRGLDIRQGYYDPMTATEKTVFSYLDYIETGVPSTEFGLPVITDSPQGWKAYEDIYDAFNAINQGIEDTGLPAINGLPPKGCLDDLFAPAFVMDEAGGEPQKKRLISGEHWHFGLTGVSGLEDVVFDFSDQHGAAIYLDVSECAIMSEEHMYRLGQHKQYGWRESKLCHPYRIKPGLSLRESLEDTGTFSLRANDEVQTIQFRPNDTYVETVDPKASFRRAQAQIAFYGGMVWDVAKENRDEHDYTILGEGGGVGLLTGWGSSGRGAGNRTEEERRQLAELHFCAALDLFVDGNRTATTTDGKPYELRRLVFYEWATSTEPRKPAWAID